MNYRKTAGLLAGGLLFAATLAACQNGQADRGAAPSGAGESKASAKPAEIVFYSTSADSPESFDQRFGTPLRKKFPNYTITYIQMKAGTKFEELMTSGQTVDIYYDSIGSFSSNVVNYGLSYDMTELVTKRKIDLNRFDGVPIEAAKSFSKGGLYGLPVSNTNLVLFYNKELFDKFGIAYPKDGMTWDEVNELARKFNRQEDGLTYTGLSISPKHLLRMNNFSEPFVDESGRKPALDTDKWRRVLDTYFAAPGQDPAMRQRTKELKRAPYNDEFFKTRTSAMYNFLSNQPTVIPDQFRAMKWDMVSFPTFKELPGIGSQAYPAYFGITAQSKEKEAAMDLIAYLVSDEYQLQFSKQGVMTVLKSKAIQDAYGTETEFKDHNLKAAFHNKFAPIQRKSNADEAIINTMNGQVVNLTTGAVDMNTFMRTLTDAAQKQIDATTAK